jgi:uncharacterized phosphatase
MEKRENGITRLVLIRHGETLANAQHLLQGTSDGPLTLYGEQQSKQLGQHLSYFPIDHIVSSDLIRALKTAEAIAEHHSIAIEIMPLIREWDCGVWDGRTAREFLEMLENTGKSISAFEPEGGETLAEVHVRAAKFVDRILTHYRGKTVAVCSHGDFMRMLVGYLLNLDVDQANLFYFGNASYSLFEHDGRGWKAIFINRLPSLDWESF